MMTSKFLNFISFIFLFIIIYIFIIDNNIYKISILIISGIISFGISTFIFDKLKFSDNIYIRILQKFILYNFLFSLFVLTLSYFDISQLIYCDDDGGSEDNNQINNDQKNIKSSSDDNNNDHYEFKLPKKIVDNTIDIIGKVITNTSPHIGAGAAAGAIGSKALQLTSGLPPLQRAAAIGGTVFISAAATTAGIKAGNAMISNNNKLNDLVKNSEYGNAYKNNESLPSPDDNMIPSIFEANNNIPLFDILESLCIFNVLELLLILLLILIFFNKYIYNIKNIFNFINKYITFSKKFNFLNKIVDKSDNYNTKF